MSAQSNIIITWFRWHFFEVPSELFDIWRGYVDFGVYYFSIGKLSATLFSPWRKYAWSYPKSFDAKEYFGVFISNMYSRLAGAASRSALILIGIVVQLFILIAGIIIIAGWFLLPLFMIGLIWFSYNV